MDKSLRSVSLLVFLTMLPVTALVPILKLLVQDRFAVGPFATHLFMAINTLAAIAAAPLMGSLSDWLGRRKELIVGAAAADAVLFLALGSAPTYDLMLAFRFLEGAAHITVLSLLFAHASTILRGSESHSFGGLGGVLTFGVALGAPLGGVLGQGGAERALWAGAGIMTAVAIGASIWMGDRSESPAARPQMKEMLRLLVVYPSVRIPILFSFVERLASGFFIASFPIFCGLAWGLGPRSIGLLITAYMLPMAALCYPMVSLSRRRPAREWLCIGGLIYGGLFSSIGYLNPVGLVFLMIACGVLSAVMFVPTLVMISRETPSTLKGSAMGLFNAVGALGFIVGPLLSGAIVVFLSPRLGPVESYRAVFLVGGLITSAAAIGSFFSRSWRDKPVAQTEPPAIPVRR